MSRDITTISVSNKTKQLLNEIRIWELGNEGSWEELLKGFIEVYDKLQKNELQVVQK